MAQKRSFYIHGVQEKVYWAIENGLRPKDLPDAVRRQGCGEAEVDGVRLQGAVEELLGRRVVANVSGRLLSLGVASPVVPYRANSPEFLGGDANLSPLRAKRSADAELDALRPNIAVACGCNAWEQPVSCWETRG